MSEQVEKNKGGRPRGPTKLTPLLIEQLVKLLSGGMFIEPSCDVVGISRETFYDWMKKSEEGIPGHEGFSDTIKKAIGDCETKLLMNISNAKEWTAKAWMLERKFPKRWGKKETVIIEYADNDDLSDAFE